MTIPALRDFILKREFMILYTYFKFKSEKLLTVIGQRAQAEV